MRKMSTYVVACLAYVPYLMFLMVGLSFYYQDPEIEGATPVELLNDRELLNESELLDEGELSMPSGLGGLAGHSATFQEVRHLVGGGA